MSDLLHLRVTVLDTWDEIPLDLPASTSLAAVKRAALTAARVTANPAEFVLKFRGATLRDESRTLADTGVPADAGLIALRGRRLAVR
jgi:hypothetical protein